MEFGSEDPEGTSISTFLGFITRDVIKTHSNLYFRSVQIASGSTQVPHNFKYRSRARELLMGLSSDQKQHLDLFSSSFS